MSNARLFCKIFFALTILPACTNLKEVQHYASSSEKTIRKFEELPYSFTRACREKCFVEQLEKDRFLLACDCQTSIVADSLTLLIYRAVKGYFEGLARLSANEVTRYRFDPLARALREAEFGEVKISREQADAYARIGNILSRAVADGYRRRKLAQYIEEANDPIHLLLEALRFNLTRNLAQQLETGRERTRSYYFEVFGDSASSAYEKKKLLEDYHAQLAEIESRKKQLANFGKALSAIAEGHQKLFENRNRMDSKELSLLLSGYAADLQDIVDEINKLKNQD